MQYTEGRMGRVFVLRLEDGERLNDTLEAFARDHNLAHALAFYLGGSATGSQVVVGPDAERTDAIVPLMPGAPTPLCPWSICSAALRRSWPWGP
jgi:predicted DNA-binding protein with PD1-like motif